MNNRYIHTRTGEVIEAVGTDAELTKIETITATGARIRRRAVKTTSLKQGLTTRRGAEWKSAYVAVTALPEGHPLAPAVVEEKAPEQTASVSEVSFMEPDLKGLSDEELSVYANGRRAEKALAEHYLDNAKKELKSRFRTPGPLIQGNVYLEVSTNRRFDPKRAQSVLSPEEYEAILVPKPDPALARETLSEERYTEVCKDHGNKLEIRTVTDEDRLRLREREEAEKAKAMVDAESFYPKELVDAPF